ncbi:MAG: hypothetical protein RIQ60_925 [Pseudomonadota bacterium]
MELLVCPVCKGPLQLDAATRQLVCNADRLGFVVRDGIAIMMENEAVHLDPDAAPAPGLAPAP